MTDRIIVLAVTRVCETLHDLRVDVFQVRHEMSTDPEVFEAAVRLRDTLRNHRDGRLVQ
jgi:hypothetical protein